MLEIAQFGAGRIGQIHAANIAAMKDAINNAYQHNPGYVTALNASNPLYNSATGTLYVTVNAAG